MKAYTDIEQSKKLAEILSIDSADMCLNISQRTNMSPIMIPYWKFKEFFNVSETPDFLIPCWSFAALMKVLPNGTVLKKSDTGKYLIGGLLYDNPIDVCVDKIIEFKEKDLL